MISESLLWPDVAMVIGVLFILYQQIGLHLFADGIVAPTLQSPLLGTYLYSNNK